MIYSRFSKINCEISKIGLGTAQFGMDYGFSKAKTQAEVDKLLHACVNKGINFLDTARDYGDSEKKIGNFIKRNPKSNFTIATKIQRILPEAASDQKTLYDYLVRSVETSLKLLGVTQLDMLFLHQTDEYITQNKKFWNIIFVLRDKGLFKSFGISVYEVEETKQLIELNGSVVDFVQIPYNIFDQRFSPLLPFLKSRNVGIISRSVFLKGMIPAESEHIPEELVAIKSFKDKLYTMAQNLNLSPTALAFLFAVENGAIDSTLCGVSTVEHLEDNIKTLDRLDAARHLEEEIKGLAISDPFLIDPRKWKEFLV